MRSALYISASLKPTKPAGGIAFGTLNENWRPPWSPTTASKKCHRDTAAMRRRRRRAAPQPQGEVTGCMRKSYRCGYTQTNRCTPCGRRRETAEFVGVLREERRTRSSTLRATRTRRVVAACQTTEIMYCLTRTTARDGAQSNDVAR